MERESTVLDQFMDQPDKLPQEVQLDKEVKFVSQFSNEVAIIEHTLDPSFGEVWDPNSDLFTLDMEPYSKESIEEIIGVAHRDNKIFFKMMLVFPSISCELYDLIAEANEKIIPPLVIFGEQPEGKDLQDGDVQLCFGRILPLLMDLWNFCERTYTVVQNMIRQMASLYAPKHKKKTQLTAYQGVTFMPAWQALGDTLALLITLDEIIRQNEQLASCAQVFKRMMRNVRNAPEKYETDASCAKRFEYLMQKLEGDLMDDLIFQNCVDRQFDNHENEIYVKDNVVFQAEFTNVLQLYYDMIMSSLGHRKEVDKRKRYLSFCGLTALHYTLFRDKLRGNSDHKKLFKQIWDIQKKIPIISLGGTFACVPAEWLARRVPEMANSIVRDPPKEILAAKREAMTDLETIFEGYVGKLYQDIVVWASRIESNSSIENEQIIVAQLKRDLLVQGVQLAHEVSILLRGVLLLHINLDKAISTPKSLLICRLMELLKAIDITYHRKLGVNANIITLLYETTTFDIAKVLMPLRGRLKENQRKIVDSQIDQLSAIELILHAMKGAPTLSRIQLIKMALSVAMQKGQQLVKESDFGNVRQLVQDLETLANHQAILKEACDCSSIYWFRVLIPIYMKNIFKNPESLPFMMYAIHDPAKILLKAQHLSDRTSLLTSYIKEVRDIINKDVVQQLQRQIENELRLHIHSVVLGQDSRDLKCVPFLQDLNRFLKLPRLNIFGEITSLKESVQLYLDTQFYNLCTISQHDWKTYEELRALAKEKYDLNLSEVYLPGATLEQGLDVLEITRNIHLFVSRYTYNLNNQMFIEKPQLTTSKNLHSIHIRHVANSIRTHGAGIMNTTVNFVYQFLSKKFFIFSQFLFDDHIKSRLTRDYRQFLDTKEETHGDYPYKKGEAFVKYVRKLGTNESGQSYLDQFRDLITEIGNALGYVRMVRSGGLRFISDAIKFVPDLTSIVNFEELAQQVEFRECTIGAARNVDSILADLKSKLSEGSDYFKMLEDVFHDEMHKEKNQHLKNFFIIVPAMTLSFVDHIILCKEKVTKKGKEASFTDDGFALGVAFILKLLHLNKEFDSLHWFSSVDNYYRDHLNTLATDMDEKRKAKKDKAEAEITTMKLTKTKIETARREFELLFYAFRSSRVFFTERPEEEIKGDGEEEEEEEEEELE